MSNFFTTMCHDVRLNTHILFALSIANSSVFGLAQALAFGPICCGLLSSLVFVYPCWSLSTLIGKAKFNFVWSPVFLMTCTEINPGFGKPQTKQTAAASK